MGTKVCQAHQKHNIPQEVTYRIKIPPENKEAVLQYLHYQYWHVLLKHIPQEDTYHKANDSSNDFKTIIEYRIFEDAIANQCFMHEPENNFVYTSQCYTENKKSTNLGHLEKNRFYKDDCTRTMKSLS